MADRRIYAGYYQRYDGKMIYVVTIAKDADTGEQQNPPVCKNRHISGAPPVRRGHV